MKPFDELTGELSLVIGTAWLSRFELARLAPRSVILTDRIAGTGFELRFNGERLADAETSLVVFDGKDGQAALIGARISSLSRLASPDPEPVRGNDLASLLPVTVSLGSCPAPVASLAGLARMSHVELGIPAWRDGDAWRAHAAFSVAGMEAGTGIVSVSGENMALEITELAVAFSGSAFSAAPLATTGRALLPGQVSRRVKRYDFSKPDCFTRRQLESLAALHGDAIRSLSLIAGEERQSLRVALTDQLNFTEYLESLSEGERVIASPASAPTRPFLAEEDRPERVFFAAAPLPRGYPASDVERHARASFERPVGGSVLISGPLAETLGDAVLEALRDAWKRFGSVNPRPGPSVERPASLPDAVRAFSPWASEWEMVALVEFVSDTGHELNVAYPIRVLEPVLRALDR